MARPAGSTNDQGYVASAKYTERTLVCSACPYTVDVRVKDDEPETWPLHRCQATKKAAPFTGSRDPVGIVTVRDWANWVEPTKPKRKPPDLSYLKVIG